jgi:hypothetical protein
VHTVAKFTAAEQVECAEGTTSQGNPPEDDFITVAKKEMIFGY